MLHLKPFQIEDLARAAMHDGAILSWEPGLGKTLAALAWPIIKEARRVLLVVPGGLHRQFIITAQRLFKLHLTRLPDVRHFYAHRLDRPASLRKDGERPRFFLTSYQELGFNGGDEWPDGVTDDGLRQTHATREKARYLDPEFRRVREVIAQLQGGTFDPRPYFEGIGQERSGVRCVWKPTLSRVIAASEPLGGGFDCVVVDEATKIQANDSHIAQGVRALSPRFRLLLSGTPIKNRLESLFWLAWWVCGGSAEPNARWPYEGTTEAREQFANQHLQHDRFLTREEEAAGASGNVTREVYDALQGAVIRNDELVIPAQLDRRLYAKVKDIIETNGGRWDRSRQAHVFAPVAQVHAGVHSPTSFLASLRPIVPGTGRKRRIEKRTPRICNIHRLWKLIAPIVIRRRKDNCGEDIVPKTIKPIYLQPGTAQQAVYQFHLNNPPIAAKGHSPSGRKLDRRVQIGMQLNNLRMAALCPDAEALGEVVTTSGAIGSRRSWTNANPKQAAALSLAAQLIAQGEQLIVGSPFTAFNQALHRRLLEAGVASVLLDGSVSQDRRGELAEAFKARRYSVMVAGENAMSLGYSLECCSHLLLASLSWAYDENAQFLDRVWRLNSPKPVTIYTMVTLNTIDERLAQLFSEKGDSSQLALDGHLIEDRVESVELDQLLTDAVRGFNPLAETIDEQSIEAQWPFLRERLSNATFGQQASAAACVAA